MTTDPIDIPATKKRIKEIALSKKGRFTRGEVSVEITGKNPTQNDRRKIERHTAKVFDELEKEGKIRFVGIEKTNRNLKARLYEVVKK